MEYIKIAFDYIKHNIESTLTLYGDQLGFFSQEERDKITFCKKFEKKFYDHDYFFIKILENKKTVTPPKGNADLLYTQIEDIFKKKLIKKNTTFEQLNTQYLTHQLIISRIINQIKNELCSTKKESKSDIEIAMEFFILKHNIYAIYSDYIIIQTKEMVEKVSSYINHTINTNNLKNTLKLKNDLKEILNLMNNFANSFSKNIDKNSVKLYFNNRHLLNTFIKSSFNEEKIYLEKLLIPYDEDYNSLEFSNQEYNVIRQEEGLLIVTKYLKQELAKHQSTYAKRAVYNFFIQRSYDLELYIEELKESLEANFIYSNYLRSRKQKFIDILPNYDLYDKVLDELNNSNIMSDEDFKNRLGNIQELIIKYRKLQDAQYTTSARINNKYQKISKSLIDEAKEILLSL